MTELLDVLRTEKKYQINQIEAAHLKATLAAVLHRDKHGGENGYRVRSLYFDTPYDGDYYDKVDGLESRRKLRLRIYGDDDSTIKLELKEKQGSLQRKRSLTVSKEEARLLCAGDCDFLLQMQSEFAKELYGRIKKCAYRPKCIVEYDRLAFGVNENNIRITLDSNLRACESRPDLFLPRSALYPVGELCATTLEVKYNDFLLSYIKDLVSLSGRTQVSMSKYCAARNITLRSDI